MRDCHRPAGGLCFWFFGDLLTRHHAASFGDSYSVVLKVNVRPFEGQKFALSQTCIDCQIEQHPDLFRDFFCPLVVAHGVVNAGVIGTLVSLCLYLVGLLNVVQEGSCLLRGKNLSFSAGCSACTLTFSKGLL